MNNKLFLLVTVVCCMLTACTNDLDQLPQTQSQTTADVVYGSEQGYKMALAKLYASFVIVGQEQGGGNADITSNNGYDFLRGYFNLQEAPTDEMAGTWLSGDKIEGLTYMMWDANDPWVADTYYRAYYSIALCNEFLSHATEAAVSENSNLAAFRAEARFLRALAYYFVLDLFGKGPFVDESMGVGAYTPQCYSSTQLFDFIEQELKDIVANGLAESNTLEYGRASKAAAWALLAKMYLNAETYGAGAHYDECITYCKQILAAGYTLESDYRKLFNADNHLRTNEIIFPFVVDAVHTVSWGATTYIVCGQCGNSSSQDPAKYGLTGGWGMFRVRGELPELFSGNETTDSRFMFYTDGQEQWLNKAIDDQSQGYFGEKFSNLTDTGEPASNTGAVGASIDFPVFRLADVKLMLAESVLRGGNGATRAEALAAVNDVRGRAFAGNDGLINEAQLTLQFILDERGRELYWECCRRTDLIRYGQFTGGSYKWQWKGGVVDGRATDAKYNVYPIPTAELSANPNLKNDNY
ncbi:MAG: RagB/SusD family nutrient uptake outer membrane protein [Muribaculaceae bacterium]|nr:RagB/SusD family nutrient uptake outer membrane protein [Muribaculaceae bacterium]